ncbi:MAG TPA: DUF6265 family protein [Gammaproteobacteria bacterium]
MNILLLLLLLSGAGSSAPLAEAAFLQGCWTGADGGSRLEESYSNTGGGQLLGYIKTTRRGKVIFFEFLRIFADAEGIWLQPYPRGREGAPRFRLVESGHNALVFENAAHDFPRRIAYRLLSSGHLLTQASGVENGKSIVQEYRTLPHACTESPPAN